jgi:hypothetical protein
MRIIAGLALSLLLVSGGARAADPEKPALETGRDIFGKPIPIEIYTRPAITLNLDTLSIAQRRLLRARYGEAVAPIDPTRVECEVDAPGVNRSIGCEFAGQDYDQSISKLLFVFRLMSMTGVSPPSIAAIPESQARKRVRRIRYDVSVVGTPPSEPAPAPQGALVSGTQIVGLDAAKSRVDYPAGALRRGATGRLTALCVVESDLSVSCSLQSFDPPANASYFQEVAPDLLLAGRVGPTLAGGGSSIGARFTFPVTFNLPPTGH